MPNIPIYIDDSYWRIGEDYDMSAISFLDQCLMDNKALFNIHFNNIGEDIDKDLESAMLGTEGTPISPISILINKLRNGKGKDGLVFDNKQEYNKSFFTRLYTNDNFKWAIIFSKNPVIKSLEQEYGYGIISENSIDNIKVFIIKKDKNVRETDYVSDIKHCNSIVVVDRYALKNMQTIERNLRPLLDKIKSTAKMTLTILSQFTYLDGNGLNLQDAYNNIMKIFPTWNIEIYDTQDTYHDRFIITNNNYITIGGGFDSQNVTTTNGMVGSKTTAMHKYVYPLFQKEISKEVMFYLQNISYTIRTITKKKSNMINGTSNYLTKFD